MRYRTVSDFPGYHKLPAEPEWKERGYGMTKEELSEYHRIGRMHESFYHVVCGVLQNIPRCKIYTQAFQSSFYKRHGVEKIYRDYAGFYHSQPGFHFMSFYTEYGIRGIDGDFAKQIKCLGEPECLFTFEELKGMHITKPTSTSYNKKQPLLKPFKL